MGRAPTSSSSSPLRVVREPISSSLTPWEALRALRGDRRPFALTGAWAGGGAVLGSEPTLTARGDPFSALASVPAVRDGVAGAVGGGWFGRLGYGAGRLAEPMRPQPPRPVPLAASSLGWYDHVLRLDAEGRWWFEALWSDEEAERLAARLSLLRSRLASSRAPVSEGFACTPFAARPSRAGHEAAVRQCIAYIGAGDLYQANITLRLEARFSGSALDLFADAASTLQPRYAAFFAESDDAAVCSLSPELFLRRTGRTVVSAPIKGTAPRNVAGAREALEASEKDRAENVMILDLMRNDLGRVASYGSVRVVDVARAEPHAGVWHLVSEVAAELRDGAGDEELLRATFPPGSVTGAPKVKALEVISTLESTGRETYTGALGFASPIAGLELNVAIRTFEVSGGTIWLGAGGGVVSDSDPASEYEEALVKARPLIAAVGAEIAGDPSSRAPSPRVALPPPTRVPRPDPAHGIFTTLRVSPRGPLELDAHLARLAASASSLYGVELDPDELRRHATPGTGTCVARLRIDVAADGAVTSAVTPVAAVTPRPPLRPLVVPGGLGEHKWSDRGIVDACEGEPLIVDLDGTVLESGWGNVWLVEEERLVTPPADGRILPGVTRDVLLSLVPAAVEPVSLDRFLAADEVFVTSSVRGVAPARGSGDVTRRVAALLERHRATAAAPTVA